jgi:hypothetical protein
VQDQAKARVRGFPLEAHAELLHDVNRSSIFRLRDGDDSSQADSREPVVHGRLSLIKMGTGWLHLGKRRILPTLDL